VAEAIAGETIFLLAALLAPVLLGAILLVGMAIEGGVRGHARGADPADSRRDDLGARRG
jgi:hypothetical protein